MLIYRSPVSIGFAMMKTSYTGEVVRASKQVMQCGSTTGRITDKVKDFSIELKNIPDCDIQIPVHSVVAIQCALREFIDVGDHYFYIYDVENVYGDMDENPLVAWKGYPKISSVKE